MNRRELLQRTALVFGGTLLGAESILAKNVDWDQFDKLCAIMATLSDIAGFFDCSEDTIERAVKRVKKCGFADYIKRKSAKGVVSLRRKQYEIAMTGNPTMLIWLGKQYLGQRDRQAHELTGKDGGPIETADKTKLTDEQLNNELRAVFEHINPQPKG